MILGTHVLIQIFHAKYALLIYFLAPTVWSCFVIPQQSIKITKLWNIWETKKLTGRSLSTYIMNVADTISHLALGLCAA